MISMLFAISSAAASPSASAPLIVVRQLLDGWREADADKVRATWATEFRLLTLRKDGQGTRLDQDSRESLEKSMAVLKPGAWDVRLGNPTIAMDHTGIATVWAPYTFYMSGRKSHCGIENFTLYRFNDQWKIVQFADTHRWHGSEVKCVDRPPTPKAVRGTH